MYIRVHYLGQLKEAAGRPCDNIERDDPCSVTDLVQQLARKHGSPLAPLLLDDRGAVRPTLLLFVGEEQVRPADAVQVKDGDEVTLVSPIAGG
jgi:molybdopterin converting factor small subunit